MSLKNKSINNDEWYVFDQLNHKKQSYSKNDLLILFMNGKLNENSFVCHPKNTNNEWVMLSRTKYYGKLKKYHDMFINSVINHKSQLVSQLSNDDQHFAAKLLPPFPVKHTLKPLTPKISFDTDDEDAFITSLVNDIDGNLETDHEQELKTV